MYTIITIVSITNKYHEIFIQTLNLPSRIVFHNNML